MFIPVLVLLFLPQWIQLLFFDRQGIAVGSILFGHDLPRRVLIKLVIVPLLVSQIWARQIPYHGHFTGIWIIPTISIRIFDWSLHASAGQILEALLYSNTDTLSTFARCSGLLVRSCLENIGWRLASLNFAIPIYELVLILHIAFSKPIAKSDVRVLLRRIRINLTILNGDWDRMKIFCKRRLQRYLLWGAWILMAYMLRQKRLLGIVESGTDMVWKSRCWI